MQPQTQVSGFRISPQQKRLWLLAQNSSAFCSGCELLIEGECHTALLEDALQRIINRHDALRTTFHQIPGVKVPFQVVERTGSASWQHIDLSAFDPSRQEAELALLRQQTEHPFELTAGPVVHASVIKLSHRKHILKITLPALCGDFGTLKNLTRELITYYLNPDRNGESDQEIVQYVQFSEWQNQLMEDDEAAVVRDYWLSHDVSTSLALKLPWELKLNGEPRWRSTFTSAVINSETCAAIDELTRRYQVTTEAFLLTCWHTLLGRLTGQTEIIVSTMFDSRKFEDLSGALGLISKQVPIQARLENEIAASALLQQVSKSMHEARSWQDYFSWEYIAGDHLTTDPAFAFDFTETTAGSTFSVLREYAHIDSFKIKLCCIKRSDTILLEWHYDERLYLPNDITRLAGEYQQLIDSFLKDPDTRSSLLKILTTAEREQLLVEWNRSSAAYPAHACMHELIEQQVEARGEAVALVYEQQQLSYRELEERANQLAHYLRSEGVGPDTVVAVCLERTIEMVVTLLGILKAGGAYLPLDASYPAERLRYMVADSEAKLLLTSARLGELFEESGRVLYVERLAEQLAEQSRAQVQSEVEAEHLAYVIYTSGSTGQPKGVMVTHRGLVNYLYWGARVYGLNGGEKKHRPGAALHSSISFDLSITSLWGPLVAGESVVLVAEEQGLEGLQKTLREQGPFGVVKLTPSHLVLLNQQLGSEELRRSAEVVVLGGEALRSEQVRVWRERAPQTRLINEYGPTETVVGCCVYEVTDATSGEGAVPIGRPIANTQMYVLDGGLEPVAVGVVGEIYIGGAGLARGYLRRPELTAEKFVPHPFAEDGARLYRTGDLGRYRSDGELEFLGRVDEQVKVRGYRVELGEIEAALNSHRDVRESVVVLSEDGDARLIGYLVANDEAARTTTELRRYLKEQLPEYMIPAAFVFLEKLPLTANGKVDRRALPAVGRERVEGGKEYVAPRTIVEEVLAGLWEDVLGVKQVGVYDNFFELGGHSLLATQVVSRAREAFGVELPLRSLFEAPTVSSLNQRIEQLQLSGMQRMVPPLVPREEVSGEEIPLSFAQQRLWFLDQLEPNNPFYNISTGVRLSGELNVEALERTLSEVVRRHEVLRTNFRTVAGEPRQVIGPATGVRLPPEDLSYLPVEQREQEVERRAGEESRKPFDLSHDSLLRVRLLRLAADEHVLLVTIHHIASDGWSIGVLIREVSALYDAYCEGRQSPLPELAIQYADFSVWQRQWLTGAVLEEQLTYWREQLRGLSNLQIPTDRVRPALQSYRGSKVEFVLGREETAALKQLSRREGATLFMVLLAAFQVLLSRYSGQSEVVVGTDVANRNYTETEGLIGFFVNQLVLRTELSGAMSFVEVLQRVREITLQAYAHQDVPFEKLVEELQPERDLSRSPLFQVKLVLQNAPGSPLEMGNLRLRSTAGEGHTSKYDLLLELSERDGDLGGALTYSTDLFDRATVLRLLEHYRQLLRGVIATPELALAQVTMLSAAEREQLLREWNETTIHLPPVCVHELFAEQARRRPEATALIYKEEQMTYGQLDRRANQLAHHLQRLGVGPDVLVGICLERAPHTIVALLAVLKAGGAYLPLDPAYPLERLSFMLEDAAVPVLLTESSVVDQLPVHWGYTLCLDEEWEQIASESEATPECAAVPENLAYVMYTSGSTGQPKGVMITHRNVVRLVWDVNYAQLDQEQTVLQLAPISFDASTFEVWGALLHGAQLQLYPGRIATAAELGEVLEPGRHWTLWLTASLFNVVVDEQVQALREVEQLLVGGEALSVDHILRAQDELPGVQLINGYGPTEGTTFSCCYPLKAAVTDEVESIPIGRPIANTDVYILDEEFEPVPVGVLGEIYIGGAGLGRGYLRRAELTAEKFVPHPFRADGGARLYRTGDQGCYLPDGKIEYRGRLDQQVKIRGFRIELGEIETVLGQHPSVQDVALRADEVAANDKRLIAYIVWSGETTPAAGELRSYLRQRLPEYMVPAYFVFLETLPLTTHGKLDLKALPALDQLVVDSRETLLAARTPVEEVLAAIWANVLNLGEVGVADNFFESGGDSIRSIQVSAQARAMGLDIPVQKLFQYQTIQELAQHLDPSTQTSSPTSDIAPFTLISDDDRLRLPADAEDAYPLSGLQSGMLFHSELTPDSSLYHDIFSFHLQAPLQPDVLTEAVQRLASRHAVLRTSFDLGSFSEPLQVVHRSAEIPFAVADLSHLSPEEQAAALSDWMETEKQQRFDWTSPPLLHVQVHVRSAETFQFSLSFHHAILDGWSVATLLAELFQHYIGLLGYDADPLPEPPANVFRDFVARERATVASEETRNYWHEKLSDVTLTRIFSTGAPSTAPSGGRIGVFEVELPEDLPQRLKELARKATVPLKSILLAAHVRTLSLLTGQPDVLSGLISHGRPETIDGEKAAGLFLNTLPFSQRLRGGTWLELLKETFQAEWELLPYRRYPLPRIQNEIGGGQSLFEVAFNFVHFHVYQKLQKFDDLKVLESKGFEATNLTLTAIFSVDPDTSALKLSFNYDAGVLSDEQVARVGRYYTSILETMAAEPSSRYDQQSRLPEAERRLLLLDWNDTAADYHKDQCIHQLFERQADAHPQALALVCEGRQLSYRELDERANQLAHYLRSEGVGPDTLVAVCLERTIEMVVSLLGILKAGGAYLPLDPSYPAERLRYMLADSKAKLLLTEAKPGELFGESTATLYVENLGEQLERHSRERLHSEVAPEHLAYVIYTSGSTGQPKGVMIAHQGLCNMVEAQIREFDVRSDSRVLQFAAFGFDASVSEIFMALCSGAVLYVASSSSLMPGDPLSSFLREERISVVTLPPSVLSIMPASDFPNLRTLISAGEQCSAEIVRRWAPGRRFFNAYGPTENTVCATIAECSDGDRRLHIGGPISNTQIHVLDQFSQLVPIGVAGELHIAGDGLARGYLGRPELTAEKFVPNPFAEDGSRLYRTGDLARYLPDGNIEFLGRMDHQVKLRGFRIELGEIESALNSHPGLRESVVLLREDGSDKRLVGYVVANEDTAVTATELRSYLRERLPEYMVPAAFVFLEKLPLTANGKVDRRALPAPELIDGDGEYVAPRTIVEEVLAGLWEDVLGVKPVGVYDNFFELGGHSLLATQLMSRVRQSFAVEVALRSLFDGPTIAELGERIEQERGNERNGAARAVARVERGERLPLSYAQQRLWFLEQMEPGSAIYNVPLALRVSGELAVEVLEASLREVIRRHEVLRTRFALRDGEAEQVIEEQVEFKLVVEDLSEQEREAAERAVQERARAEAQQGFDLSTGPMLRAKLLRLNASEHVLLLTMHHIVSDGWSLGVLVKEIGALYEAYAQGETSPLPELPVQYADYAVWQREYLQGAVLEQQLSYWRAQLAGAAPVLELPTDYARPAVLSNRGASQAVTLSPRLTEQLQQLSRREGVTLFMSLLAAFDVLLWRYTGQTDLSVGTPIAGRNQAEIESLIGFFVNTLVLRVQLDGRESYRELLGRVREVTLGAYGHQDVPFERLVEELQPDRDLSHTPLFQVAFALQQESRQKLELEGVETRPEFVESETAKFDQTWSLVVSEAGIKLRVEYREELFEAVTIERMLNHFENLLVSLVESPEQSLSSVSYLTAAERQQLLVERNSTQREYPRDKCIHQLFEEQAQRTPEAVAVIYQDSRLSYADLNERSNQLAHHLRTLGVGPESRVGLLMERSLEMIVGLLGILKAGGAYVPLDPEYPQQRLSFILTDSELTVVITQQRMLERLPSHAATVVCLDRDWPEIAVHPSSAAGVEVSADNLAYVIYTSGSTGIPKGVEVVHRSVLRLLCGVDYAKLDGGQCIMQLAPLAFDASTFEIWGALLHGGHCVMYEERVATLEHLRDVIAQHHVQTMWLTASLYNLIIDENPSVLQELEELLIGGEALSVQHVRKGLQELPATQIINGYGPTEATTFTCCYRIERELPPGRAIPIGKPIGNTQVFLLDDDFEPVAAGVVGKLFIGGDGLARGYLRRPELTAEKFVPHPFAEDGARLYCTGDLARYRPDGNIEFLGRVDEQVKMRGFRIELGEIESVLRASEGVNEAVVILEESQGEKRLIGYVVAEAGAALRVERLRAQLREQLPEYMVPAVFMELEKLPLTANGKVDRRALPAPERIDGDGEYVAPRTIVEEVLAGLWEDVLGVKQVGVFDNFFELGGHSLLATQLMSRVRQSFAVEVALRSLFDGPTIAELGERIEQERGNERNGTARAVARVERGERLLLSYAQQRLWFLEQMEPGSAIYNVPLALRVSGELAVEVLEASLREVIRRHEVLRTRFELRDGEAEQVIEEQVEFKLVVEDLSEQEREAAERAVQERARAEAQQGFDLSTGPMLRAKLLRLNASEHVLLLTMHHIVSDGWSLGVLVKEIGALYQAYEQGETSPLPELPVQYADYAVWQREYLQGAVLEQQLSYWRAQLAGAAPLLELPTDRPRPQFQTFNGSVLSFDLPVELSEKLMELTRREGATLFMTLFAAFVMVLQRNTGQEDIVVGTSIANRNRQETEHLLGCFFNQLALRVNLSGDPTFRELLRRVRECCLQAYAHQDVPFEKLLETLKPERNPGYFPIFQVMFILQNATGTTLEIPGLKLSPLETQTAVTRVDLALMMEEGPRGLKGVLEYNTDLFDRATIVRFKEHLEATLAGIVKDPDQDLQIIGTSKEFEPHELVQAFNDDLIG